MQFGRCSVRRFYPHALKVLQANKELFESFIEHRVRLDEAEEVSRRPSSLCPTVGPVLTFQYYAKFNDGLIAKTVFVADHLDLNYCDQASS